MIIQSPRSILSLVCTAGAVAAAALAGITPATAPAAPPAIYHLGSLLGGTASQGLGVNDAGQVAGVSNRDGGFDTHAIRYDGTPGSGGVMRDLHTFGPDSVGAAINNAGQVAGWWNNLFIPGRHAFRYDGTPGSDGVMHDLGTLGGADADARDINDSGQVTGGSSFITGDTLGSHAFRYDGAPGSGGVMRDLGTLGGTGSRGYGINNAGQVTGNSFLGGATAEPTHAFRYDGTPGSGGIMRDLGALGGTNSYGVGINDAGQVAGYSDIAGNAAYHAFRYDGTPGSGGIMRDLGALGGMRSQGLGINNAGQVVGWSEITGSTNTHAFLYTGTPGVDGQMLDLDAWLDANNPTEGAKWTLIDELFRHISISRNTGWITGVGLYDPDGPGGVALAERAYLLDASSLIVPEPSGLALLALVVPALLRRRHLSRHDFWRGQTVRSICCAFLAILLGASAASTAFAAASLTPLGYLSGDLTSTANGVSGDGSVVVGTSGGYGGQAFRWTAAGGMVGLGRPPGDFYSYARSVSADGSVVVGGSDYAADDGSEVYRIQAARWTAAGGMQGLGYLLGGGAISVALGVSGDGSVTVGSSDSASGDQAFRWTAAGGMQDLGDLPGGSFQSGASAVSGNGSVIVGSGTSANGNQAFRWTSGGGMVGLGFLPGDLYSDAFGVNADGSMVVGTSSSASSMHVFRWTSAGGMVGLGSLPGDFNPWGYSADGSVVVGYETGDDISPHYTALYWTADGGMQALWDVLLSHGVDPAADGWSRLEFAKAISADGNTIVGDGTRNGATEAFVAVIPTIVPEPAAGALALLGASSILIVRRCSPWRHK